MQKKKRKKYTQEFRDSAVKLIAEQGYQIIKAARNLGINATMLGLWKRETEGGGNDSSDNPSVNALHAELALLRKENINLCN